MRTSVLVIAAAALAAAGCRQGGGVAGQPLLAPVPPAYPASLAPWPPPVPTAAIGRGVAPSYAVPAAIAGTAAVQGPIVVERVWPVPDPAAEARAVVTGTIGDRFAVEVVAVDAGEVRWRDLVACQAPVVHVTAEVIVCADARGIVAVDVAAGVAVWRSPLQFAGADGGLVVARRPPAEPDPGAASPAAGSPAAPDPGATDAGVAAPVDPGAIVVLDAATGLDLATVAPPAGVRLDEIRVACRRGDDLELWAWGADHLDRLAIGVGGAVAVATVALPRAPARVSPCGDPALVELPIPGSIERALYAIRPDAPRLADAPLIERGFWRRGPGEVGVATAAGVEVRDAALAPVAVLSSAEVGRELDSRGARRLVRGHGGLAVLLEDDVPIAYLDVPSHADSAVLGDRYLLAGGWQAPARSLADRVDRFRLPDGDRAVVVPSIMGVTPPVPPVDVPDLPAPVAAGAPVELADAAAWDVGAVLVDPAAPGRLYVAVLEQRPDADHGAGLAAFDLATRRWAWHSADACPPGTPVALAATAAVVVCGSRRSTPGGGRVRAVARDDGAVRWDWRGDTVDAVVAGGGVVAVVVGRRAQLVDAATGAPLGEVAADQGFVPQLALTSLRGTDVVVDVERGAVVARLPRAAMLPLWAVAVDDAIVAIAVAGDRITVELAGGELYFVDVATGDAVAAAGWARRWRLLGAGDRVAVEDVLPGGADAPDRWRIATWGVDGVPRFAVALALEPPWLLGPRGGAPGAPVVAAYGPAGRAAAVLDPDTGAVRARVTLPDRTVPGAVFATMVDGAPVAGAVLRQPLGVVLF